MFNSTLVLKPCRRQLTTFLVVCYPLWFSFHIYTLRFNSQSLTLYPESAQVSTQASFSGPVSKDYTVTSNLDVTSTVWSPCGASTALNVNSQVRLTGSSGSGLITDDSIDGKVTFVVGVQWQTC